nr:RecName: Full=RNA-binding protein [Lithobates pipiens]
IPLDPVAGYKEPA